MTEIKIMIKPRYWTKTKFKVGIEQPSQIDSISSGEYKKLVKEAFGIWEDKLHSFAKTETEHNHLQNFSFNLHDGLLDTDDIHIKWWTSNDMNGLMEPDNNQGEVKLATIYISQKKPAGNIHTSDEIRSIVIHETGHVLNIGHCYYQKDLMFTANLGVQSPPQPDPSRQISNLDLEVVSDTFRAGYTPPADDTSRTMDLSEWHPV